MKINQIEYFEWVKRNYGKVACNLAISGISTVDSKIIAEITPPLTDWHKSPLNFEGDPELIGALSEQYKMPKENILTASGTSKANFLAMTSLIKPTDVVLIETPYYEPLFRVPQMIGARIELIERLPQNKYNFDIEAIKEVMSSHVSMIIISNLHNPSGEMLSKTQLKELCDIAEDYKCYLLSDEVYREFNFNDSTPQACEMSEYAISTNSLTKVYGLPVLRAGWLIGDSSVINKCLKMKYHTSVITSPITEKIAYHALKNIDKLKEFSRSIIENNRPIIKKWIEAQEYLDLEFPEFAGYCFPRFFKINVTELSEMLSNYYDTLIVPGKFFGAPEYARIGFGTPQEDLEAGLEQIENAVKALINSN